MSWNRSIPLVIDVVTGLRQRCKGPWKHRFVAADADFVMVLAPLIFMNEHQDRQPTSEQYTSPPCFPDALLRVIWVIVEAVLTSPKGQRWGTLLPAASFLYQLFYGRAAAKAIELGHLEHRPEGAREWVRYLLPADALVKEIARNVDQKWYPRVRMYGTQFVTRLLLTMSVAQQFSGLTPKAFFNGLCREDGAYWLILTYRELIPARALLTSDDHCLAAISTLSVAENITRPSDGILAQASFIEYLLKEERLTVDASGSFTIDSANDLTPAETYALRPPTQVWPRAKTICHGCGNKSFCEHSGCVDKSCAHETRRKCGACERSLYCGKPCQRKTWKGGHKRFCAVWRSVGEREKEPEVRGKIGELVLDPLDWVHDP